MLVMLLGLLVGSFLNVCIYRIPRKEEIVYTPSHCCNCGTPVKWYDLIPVISYILLGGKCRTCKTKISIQYPIIELSNGTAYMGIFLMYGYSKETIIYCALFSLLLVIAMIDYRHYVIPNGLIIAMGILGLFQIVLHLSNWYLYVIGFFAASLPLYLIAVITKGKMGGGDIKLMAMAGLVIGWQNILLGLFVGSLIGSIIGITLMAIKVVKRGQAIPFGPFLAMGIMISALYGNEILSWYLGHFI